MPGGARTGAGVGAALIAFSAIFVKLSHTSDSTAAIFRCLDASVLLIPLAVWEGRRAAVPRSARARAAALGAGGFFAVDLVMWDRAITDVGAGLATVLANVQVVLVPLAAWALLREHPSRRVLVALVPVLVGVLLISGVLEQGAYGAHPVAGAVLGAGAGLAYVGALLLLRFAGRDLSRPVAPLAEMTGSATLVALLIGWILGDATLAPPLAGAAWLALLAISSQVLGWLAISRALPRLPAATTSLLLMIQPVGSLLLGALCFAERPSALQLLGVLAVLGAVLYATRSGAQRNRSRSRSRSSGATPGPSSART